MGKQPSQVRDDGATGSVAWLGALLSQLQVDHEVATAPLSKQFARRCQEGGDAAFAAARIGHERLRVGFVPLSFDAYLSGLARAAGVSLAPLTRWFGVRDLDRTDETSGPAVARLGRAVGLSLPELLVHVRIGYAEAQGAPPITLLAHRDGRGRQNPLAECEDVLRELERAYDAPTAQELRLVESAIRAAY